MNAAGNGGKVPGLTTRFAHRAAALGSGFVLGLATSGGIAFERISEGATLVALGVNALLTGVAVMVLLLTSRRSAAPGRSTLVGQAIGAAAGVALVHLVVRQRFVPEVPWLSEGPLQLVNDATSVLATLILIWACARGLDARVFVLALLLVTAYRITQVRWHLDHAPHGFQTTVQQLVVMQFAASSLGLLLFTFVTRRTRAS
ncbi:MAG: hypothetical protein JWP97_6228 [Labilithrix sp.]|nr:hypothetical protein [Labilithrix sp.]